MHTSTVLGTGIHAGTVGCNFRFCSNTASCFLVELHRKMMELLPVIIVLALATGAAVFWCAELRLPHTTPTNVVNSCNHRL